VTRESSNKTKGGSKLAVVIMAAGSGSRIKSRRPVVLHEMGGKPLLSYVIAAVSQLVPPNDIYAVIGYQAERVREALNGTGIHFIEQTDQRSTGHAILCASSVLADYEDILILSGNVPLIRRETIEQVVDFHSSHDASMTILTAAPENPEGYGRVLRRVPGSVEVEAIVEQKALTPTQQSIREINSGIYAFKTGSLLTQLGKLRSSNIHGELYLTDMAALLGATGGRVVAVQAAEAREVLGANSIAELVALDAFLRADTSNRLMAAGVTIFRPETCVIDAEVQVGPDTVIEPFVQLLGRTSIGADCNIRSYSVIENSTISDGVLLRQSCIVSDSTIAKGAKIGPFAHLRPGSEIGEDAHVGNFVEIKKTKLGKGAKANHLTYLGDATVGAGSNIGAGVITCNYDGVLKHPTRIGEGVFVGSDSTLVAPISIEDGAYIGAGSCITKDVPAGALAVGRSRQVTKEGWASSRNAKKQTK
jgi:bifunctional UDP-N-acetylglucosamine pyrophosphorylase / glucosamine-1-phosphate N-acetyltransferase